MKLLVFLSYYWLPAISHYDHQIKISNCIHHQNHTARPRFIQSENGALSVKTTVITIWLIPYSCEAPSNRVNSLHSILITFLKIKSVVCDVKQCHCTNMYGPNFNTMLTGWHYHRINYCTFSMIFMSQR